MIQVISALKNIKENKSSSFTKFKKESPSAAAQKEDYTSIYDKKGIVSCAFKERLISIDKKQKTPDLSFGDTPWDFSIQTILSVLESSKDLTLSSGSLLKERYDNYNIYDFPLLFATACYNTKDKEGSAYINMKTPEIFKGIPKQELFDALDWLSLYCRENPDVLVAAREKIKIAGKEFYFEALGHGVECNAFKISIDEKDDKNSVIYKLYYIFASDGHAPAVAPGGFYGNIGMLREANMASVVDVPDLYFANPILSKTPNSDYYEGLWALVENAQHKEVKKGLMLDDWLSDMWLYHNDAVGIQNHVNNICIDLGFIKAMSNPDLYGNGWGDDNIKKLYSKYIEGKTTQDLIDFIKATME